MSIDDMVAVDGTERSRWFYSPNRALRSGPDESHHPLDPNVIQIEKPAKTDCL